MCISWLGRSSPTWLRSLTGSPPSVGSGAERSGASQSSAGAADPVGRSFSGTAVSTLRIEVGTVQRVQPSIPGSCSSDTSVSLLPRALVDERALPDRRLLLPLVEQRLDPLPERLRGLVADLVVGAGADRLASRASAFASAGSTSPAPRFGFHAGPHSRSSEASTPVRPRSSARGANGVTENASTCRYSVRW